MSINYKKIILACLLVSVAGQQMHGSWFDSWSMPDLSFVSIKNGSLKVDFDKIKSSQIVTLATIAATASLAVWGVKKVYSWYCGKKSSDGFVDSKNDKAARIKRSANLDAGVGAGEEKDGAAEAIDFMYEDRESWSEFCKKVLPQNSSLAADANCARIDITRQVAIYNEKREEMKRDLLSAIQATKNCMNNYMNAASWTDKKMRTKGDRFEPFVQRLDLSANAQVVMHGDFHGDIHSFIKELSDLERKGFLEKDSFKIAQDNGYMLFLGDYVDRGAYGAEVIYTICRLKLANPDRVFMVRGNHEDQELCEYSGFGNELRTKFQMNHQEKSIVYSLYEYMPVALYLGCNGNYIQCCHGGLEHGYNPGKLLTQNVQFDLLGKLQRSTACVSCDMPLDNVGNAARDFVPENCSDCFTGNFIGFMWYDFVKSGASFWKPGRGLAADESLTQRVLDYQNILVAEHGGSASVKGIIRAHQHAGPANRHDPVNLMKELIENYGVYKLWREAETASVRQMKDGLVWTFNVAPDSGYGYLCKYGFDAYAIVAVADLYDEWTMEVCNTRVVEGRRFMGYESA